MEIINTPPPESLLNAIRAAGMEPNLSTTVFTYGSKLYNPGGQPIPDHLLAHEEVHERQQGDDPAAWWSQYCLDIPFRLEQELEAYREQYAYIAEFEHDRERRLRYLMSFARALSGPMYGNIITAGDAMKKIKQ